MNVASLPLCKELFGLSGWGAETTEFHYYREPDEESLTVQHVTYCPFYAEDEHYPAYDLGYLMRKLSFCNIYHDSNGVYIARFNLMSERLEADTPEDAAALLAIELFRQGVLNHE